MIILNDWDYEWMWIVDDDYVTDFNEGFTF